MNNTVGMFLLYFHPHRQKPIAPNPTTLAVQIGVVKAAGATTVGGGGRRRSTAAFPCQSKKPAKPHTCPLKPDCMSSPNHQRHQIKNRAGATRDQTGRNRIRCLPPPPPPPSRRAVPVI
ncbi:hypothetical protein ABZP36_011271 [Zizania latifolia]